MLPFIAQVTSTSNMMIYQLAISVFMLAAVHWPLINSKPVTSMAIDLSGSVISSNGISFREEAQRHFQRVRRTAKCSIPQQRVVCVRDFLPKILAHKKYTPHCTVLHYCGSDVGCCPGEGQVCGPISIQPIELPFLVTEVTLTGQRRQVVQLFKFENHTECGCKLPTSPVSIIMNSNPSTQGDPQDSLADSTPKPITLRGDNNADQDKDADDRPGLTRFRRPISDQETRDPISFLGRNQNFSR